MTPSHPRFYRPELDVLRFLAFMLVFLHHGLPTMTGLADSSRIAASFGVCLFFLLSSYLITELMEREQEATGTIHIPAFFVRRILRIWPLYFAALFTDFALQHYASPGAFTVWRLLACLLLVGNWFVVYHGFSLTFTSALWSISVEEQFYLLWPLVRKVFRRRGSLVFSLAMLALAFGTMAMLAHMGQSGPQPVWVNSFVQFQFFSSGALLALCLKGHAPAISTFGRCALLCAGLLFFVAGQEVFHLVENPVPLTLGRMALGYLCVNAGCVSLFLSFLGAQRLGAASALIYLGKISYGLYVYHWMMLRICIRGVAILSHKDPISGTAQAVLIPCVAFGLTVGAAALSYRFLESPILKLKGRFEFVRTRAA